MSQPTTAQLKQAIAIAERIEALQNELNQVLESDPVSTESASEEIFGPAPGKAKRKMSAAGRAGIGAAVKARWAKVRGEKTPEAGKKRTMSAAGRAAISAAARKRWAQAKARGKSKL